MFKNFSCATLVVVFLLSCNDSSNSSANGPVESIAPAAVGTSSCYQAITDKDTIDLHLTINGTNVSGELSYNLLEKDKNKGTLQGEMSGDTIFASYNFMSEGTESVREVAFIKKGDNLIEGFGPVEDRNGKMFFKDHSSLVFNNANLLNKIECSSSTKK